MGIHKEGYVSIAIAVAVAALLTWCTWFLDLPVWLRILLYGLVAFLLIAIFQFFRKPNRSVTVNENHVLAPADGKVVAIEEVQEDEFFKDKRLQISIFMSPVNVHINWAPVTGEVKYIKYHPGKNLVAWHPKSSALNERTTLVIESKNMTVLIRQIAGAVARRIVYYPEETQTIEQGAELGFIKFGSRVDLLLPTGTKVAVELGQKVTGTQTVIATCG